jgi:hypothetical protein
VWVAQRQRVSRRASSARRASQPHTQQLLPQQQLHNHHSAHPAAAQVQRLQLAELQAAAGATQLPQQLTDGGVRAPGAQRQPTQLGQAQRHAGVGYVRQQLRQVCLQALHVRVDGLPRLAADAPARALERVAARRQLCEHLAADVWRQAA